MYNDVLLERLAVMEPMSLARRLSIQIPHHEDEPLQYVGSMLFGKFLRAAMNAVHRKTNTIHFARRPGDQVMLLRIDPWAGVSFKVYTFPRNGRSLEDWCLESIYTLIDDEVIPFEREDFSWLDQQEEQDV